jgi:hypothetical protein
MKPPAPAAIRIRINPWYFGALSGAIGISLAVELLARGAEIGPWDLLRIGAWLAGLVLFLSGVVNYMRVSPDSIAHFRNYIGRRETVPLRPQDLFVVTDEGAFIWRHEGHYQQLDVQPHWAGRREWNRLRA